jgi:hypothetical protein
MANADYRSYRVGMAVNGGRPAEKERLIELLLEAGTLSSGLDLFVDGCEFEKIVKGIVGGLQRSLDASTSTNGN